MSSLDLEEDPSSRVREELDRVQSQYSKLELVTKGASKFLGDGQYCEGVEEAQVEGYNILGSCQRNPIFPSSGAEDGAGT